VFRPPSAPEAAAYRGPHSLERLELSRLQGFEEDDLFAAFDVFLRSCKAIAEGTPPLRGAANTPLALQSIARAALRSAISDSATAKWFFKTNFRPFRIKPKESGGTGFLTGYYEPFVEASLVRTSAFLAPVLGWPHNFHRHELLPPRAAIEAGALDGRAQPILWLRDLVEVFLAQVQGSARARLADGTGLRLIYAGRNGHPYTSIGRLLMENGEIPESEMSLAALKYWIRTHGQNEGEAGLALMRRNQSYVFFTLAADDGEGSGPIGGQGIALSPLRSIAIDRAIWPYGLPFWISAELPWQSQSTSCFRRLMITQDTGSAIIGPARADIFFGSGDDAGARAGDIRHGCDMTVFLPAKEPMKNGDG